MGRYVLCGASCLLGTGGGYLQAGLGRDVAAHELANFRGFLATSPISRKNPSILPRLETLANVVVCVSNCGERKQRARKPPLSPLRGFRGEP